MEFSQYAVKTTEEVLKELKSRETGLSEDEAKDRQGIYGLNEIKIRESGFLDVFFRQFKSPFFLLLFIAALVAFLIREFADGLVIIAFVFLNVILGFFQEFKAVRAAAALKKYVPLKSRIVRQGKEKFIDRKFLVPGDIVLLEPGNIVPADIRLLKARNFFINEEVLSGESAPVVKTPEPLKKVPKEFFEATNIVFAGTSVVSGEAEGIVIFTAGKTAFGEIAKLTGGAEHKSAYEKGLSYLSGIILKIVVISIVFIYLANLLLRGTENTLDFLIFCIALIVSIIPEALPVVITFAFSSGALKLAKKKVVVKRLSAVEGLGDMEILCTDKTGTLTENKLSLEGIFSPAEEKCLLYGLLSSSVVKEEIDSTESSFDSALIGKASPDIRRAISKFREISEIPFESERLINSSLLEDEKGNRVLIARGAPEAIFKFSSGFEESGDKKQIKEEIEREGRNGRRVLAVGYKRWQGTDYSEADENGLTFLGFFSFVDPLKKTAKEAVYISEKLKVQVKILTGDSFGVAGAVAKEIGLIRDPEKEVILGSELDLLDENDFGKTCRNFSVFARVSPKTKFKIIRTLQKKYEVGFLGEGINDAPSLKIADVAIAVSSGSDISKEVSDIILLEKDLRVIIDGIKGGRNIFSNINKYIKCTLASNFGNFYSIAAISLFIPYLPMLPVQILLVNLLSDFPLISVVTDKVDTEELRKPKFYQLHQIVPLIMLLAIVSTAFDFIFFGIFHKVQPELLQTLWFIESILTEIFLIFSIRTRSFFLKARFPSLPLIVLSFITILITILLPYINLGKEFFHFVSPPLTALFAVLSLVVIYFAVSEIVKLAYFRRKA